MGLQKTITLDNGLLIENAYLKIVGVSGDKSAIAFNIGAFLSRDKTAGQPLKMFYNSVSADITGNVWRQVYEFFKGTEDGQDSVDA